MPGLGGGHGSCCAGSGDLARAVSRRAGARGGAAELGAALPAWAARPRRAQEFAADRNLPGPINGAALQAPIDQILVPDRATPPILPSGSAAPKPVSRAFPRRVRRKDRSARPGPIGWRSRSSLPSAWRFGPSLPDRRLRDRQPRRCPGHRIRASRNPRRVPQQPAAHAGSGKIRPLQRGWQPARAGAAPVRRRSCPDAPRPGPLVVGYDAERPVTQTALNSDPARASGAAGKCGGGGAKGSRTPDLLNAIQALSQLSYGPPGSGPAI